MSRMIQLRHVPDELHRKLKADLTGVAPVVQQLHVVVPRDLHVQLAVQRQVGADESARASRVGPGGDHCARRADRAAGRPRRSPRRRARGRPWRRSARHGSTRAARCARARARAGTSRAVGRRTVGSAGVEQAERGSSCRCAPAVPPPGSRRPAQGLLGGDGPGTRCGGPRSHRPSGSGHRSPCRRWWTAAGPARARRGPDSGGRCRCRPSPVA